MGHPIASIIHRIAPSDVRPCRLTDDRPIHAMIDVERRVVRGWRRLSTFLVRSRISCVGAFVACLFAAGKARAEEPRSPPIQLSPAVTAGVWVLAQLVPSPLLVAGSSHVGAGFRWQVTPVVYSFGVAAHPFRAFVVDPVARHSGAIELYLSPEWACCAPTGTTSWIGRAGSRLYLPLIGRGESLASSVGASYYRAGDSNGAAAEVGVYVLYGVFGLTLTVAPTLKRREVIGALTIRYF